jgi:PrtD family type I secretion system ABC transporter
VYFVAKQPNNILDNALLTCKSAFWFILLFSFIANILLLALPIYSLQVLDRVISSASVDTLLMLSLVVSGAFIALGLVQIARSMAMVRIGEWLDNKLAPDFLYNAVSLSAISNATIGSQSLRDLNTVRQFLTGQAMNSILDAPWALIYIGIIFAIHPITGFIAIGGGIMLLLMAWLNEYATKPPLNTANELAIKGLGQVDIAARNAEVVEAMGMMPAILSSWRKVNDQMIAQQSLASNRASIIATTSKILRMILQIAVMGMGAYLTLKNEITLGGIIAGSILIGKALAPFESAIDTWKQVVSARKSYERMQTTLKNQVVRNKAMSLPAPEGILSVEKVVFAPPSSQRPTLKGVSFALEAGEILGVIGPSAAGKSTLAKLITGVWRPSSGVVRLDGADVYSWNREEFGQYAGYLPQDVELFNGTVKDNIARLQENASPEDIVDAAKLAGVHDMILHLPNGYETQVGQGGSILSGGQRQRIGLARAFFGNPKLVILDEPNANLDESGERGLMQTIFNAKGRKITTVVISHRTSILQAVDKILVMNDGLVAAFGPRQDVLAQINKHATALRPAIGV